MKIPSNLQLKECPWCGSIAKLVVEPASDTPNHGYYGNYVYYVKCDNKKCNAKAPMGMDNDIYQSSDDAIAHVIQRWNQRAGDPEF